MVRILSWLSSLELLLSYLILYVMCWIGLFRHDSLQMSSICLEWIVAIEERLKNRSRRRPQSTCSLRLQPFCTDWMIILQHVIPTKHWRVAQSWISLWTVVWRILESRFWLEVAACLKNLLWSIREDMQLYPCCVWLENISRDRDVAYWFECTMNRPSLIPKAWWKWTIPYVWVSEPCFQGSTDICQRPQLLHKQLGNDGYWSYKT